MIKVVFRGADQRSRVWAPRRRRRSSTLPPDRRRARDVMQLQLQRDAHTCRVHVPSTRGCRNLHVQFCRLLTCNARCVGPRASRSGSARSSFRRLPPLRSVDPSDGEGARRLGLEDPTVPRDVDLDLLTIQIEVHLLLVVALLLLRLATPDRCAWKLLKTDCVTPSVHALLPSALLARSPHAPQIERWTGSASIEGGFTVVMDGSSSGRDEQAPAIVELRARPVPRRRAASASL
jgi:hypothetical protein